MEDAGLESEEKLLQVPHLGHPAGLHAWAVWTSVVSRLLPHRVPLPSPPCRISASLPQGGFSRLEAPGGQERLAWRALHRTMTLLLLPLLLTSLLQLSSGNKGEMDGDGGPLNWGVGLSNVGV